MNTTIIKRKSTGTIILIHGNSSSKKVFESVLNSELIQQTKIAIDLPGHGNSVDDYKNHSNFSIQFFKEKLLEFIKTIDDDILLVGNSLGGHLAIEISDQVKNLKGLVIFGTPPVKKPLNLEEAFLPVAALQTFFTENPTEQEIINAVEVAIANAKSSKIITEDFKKTNPKVRKCIANDILENRLLNEYEIYKNLEVPKFILSGDKDPSVNLEYVRNLNKVSKNSNLIVLNNCGHYPSLEQPEVFNKLLSEIAKKVFV